MKSVAYVGIDYHVNFLSIAVVVEGSQKIYQTMRLRNHNKIISKYMNKLAKDFEIKACYEASSCGYMFYRNMISWGYHCDVIAPSLIPKKPGDRRKNDFRDARNLAQHYANGMLSVVRPPSEYEESVRSLLRCRLTLKDAQKRVKQQLNSFLLTQGCLWQSSKWTATHRQWLLRLQMPHKHLQQVLEEHLGHLDYLESRVEYLDKQIEELAQSDIYAPSVKKLCAFKGIRTLTAMLLIAELTDFRRFSTPTALMAFLGLIPSEDTSGDHQKTGSITKAGNSRCRKYLIESVQHYVKRPHISATMKNDLAHVDAHSANIAIKCMKRLHKRYWSLTMKGKIRQVAMTAIAREFAGFIWAMMQPEPVAA